MNTDRAIKPMKLQFKEHEEEEEARLLDEDLQNENNITELDGVDEPLPPSILDQENDAAIAYEIQPIIDERQKEREVHFHQWLRDFEAKAIDEHKHGEIDDVLDFSSEPKPCKTNGYVTMICEYGDHTGPATKDENGKWCIENSTKVPEEELRMTHERLRELGVVCACEVCKRKRTYEESRDEMQRGIEERAERLRAKGVTDIKQHSVNLAKEAVAREEEYRKKVQEEYQKKMREKHQKAMENYDRQFPGLFVRPSSSSKDSI